MRRLITVTTALIVASSLFPTSPSEASHRTATVTAAGEVTLWDCLKPADSAIPCSGPPEARHLWAPVSPACGSTPCPGPRISDAFDWALGSGDEDSAPDGGVECTVVGSTRECHVTAYGSLGSSNFFTPLWCGGPGLGQIRAIVDLGDEVIDLGGTWIVHPGPQLAWRLTKRTEPHQGGVGVGTMTLVPADGACGLNPADGFAPAHRFTASLTLDWQATL